MTLVENGHADPIATGPRINELVAERKRLAAELSQQPASNVVEFFPKAAERYRQKVADIHAALSRGETGDHEAVALVRSLIGRIVVHATPAPEPLDLEVEGSLAALMSDAPELEHSGISCCMPPQPLMLSGSSPSVLGLFPSSIDSSPNTSRAILSGCGAITMRSIMDRTSATAPCEAESPLVSAWISATLAVSCCSQWVDGDHGLVGGRQRGLQLAVPGGEVLNLLAALGLLANSLDHHVHDAPKANLDIG